MEEESNEREEKTTSSFGEKKPFQEVILIDCSPYYKRGEQEEKEELKWGRILYKNLPFVFGYINEKAPIIILELSINLFIEQI